MTAELVNLRQRRKVARRTKAAQTAAERRAAFGQSRADRERLALETARALHHLDGHRRDDGEDGDVR